MSGGLLTVFLSRLRGLGLGLCRGVWGIRVGLCWVISGLDKRTVSY